MRGVGANDVRLSAAPREREHLRSQIRGDRCAAGRVLRDELRKIASAAGEVKNDGFRRQCRAQNSVAFPASVHATGKRAGDEVIARSDDAEHAAHEAGVMFFGRRFHARVEIVSGSGAFATLERAGVHGIINRTLDFLGASGHLYWLYLGAGFVLWERVRIERPGLFSRQVFRRRGFGGNFLPVLPRANQRKREFLLHGNDPQSVAAV